MPNSSARPSTKTYASKFSRSYTQASKQGSRKTQRLDAELVRRGLISSRTEAKRAIENGRVIVRGLPVTRPASLVGPDDPIALASDAAPFVSRGGSKLDSALERLDVVVAGRRWLDAGASTGGFTDRLLKGGASAVIALDVGYGQIDWGLRNDDRVVVIERTNVRHLEPDDLPWKPDGVTADLSFISLTKVLPALARVATTDTDFILLVKPQFEAGREAVDKGGVVKDPGGWRAAIENVVAAGARLGLGLIDCVLAEPPGPAGNREFFIHLRRRAMSEAAVIDREIERASR